jgi:hypothetical protein
VGPTRHCTTRRLLGLRVALIASVRFSFQGPREPMTWFPNRGGEGSLPSPRRQGFVSYFFSLDFGVRQEFTGLKVSTRRALIRRMHDALPDSSVTKLRGASSTQLFLGFRTPRSIQVPCRWNTIRRLGGAEYSQG